MVDKDKAPKPIKEELSDSFEIVAKDNKSYTFKIYLTEKELEVNVIDPEQVGGGIYKIKFTLDDIHKIHRYFKIYENLQEFKDYLVDSIENKELDITKSSGKVTVKGMVLLRRKTEEISFSLNLEKISSEEIITLLCDEVTKLKTENKELKKQLGLGNPELAGSILLTSTEQLEFLKKAIKDKMGKEIDKIIKVFNAKRDGYSPHIFHSKCDYYTN